MKVLSANRRSAVCYTYLYKVRLVNNTFTPVVT